MVYKKTQLWFCHMIFKVIFTQFCHFSPTLAVKPALIKPGFKWKTLIGQLDDLIEFDWLLLVQALIGSAS